MVYNPLAVKVALVEGLRLGKPVLREISIVAEAVFQLLKPNVLPAVLQRGFNIVA
jgi:hypothetical protein